MAQSGIIQGTTNNQYCYCWIEYSIEQDINTNSSDVIAELFYQRTNEYSTGNTYTGTLSIDGQVKSVNVKATVGNTPCSVNWFRTTVPHNSDGTKVISFSATGGWVNQSVSATYLYGEVVANTIPRAATISSASAFNDEENPTIEYTNRSGMGLDSLQAAITINGKYAAAYRDISKVAGSYTFNLTEAERNILRQNCTNSKSATVEFLLKSEYGSQSYTAKMQKTMTIVNAAPSFNPTIVDSNSTTVALTGSNSRFIRYFSNAAITTGATANKYATLVSQGVSCAGATLNSSSGTIEGVESGDFSFQATDSRGFAATLVVSKTIVPYVKLTCNLEPQSPNAAGEMDLVIKGNYYNGNFGNAANILSLKYRWKEENGNYTNWITTTPTISNNTYSLTVPIEGLDYQAKYVFQAQVNDRLMNITTDDKAVKSTPVFDWGEYDFAFNVPVYFRAGGISAESLLWQGTYYMTANHTANLSAPISTQMNGIVVVFSPYTDGTAQDIDWHCYYVPKGMVSRYGGTAYTFNMMSGAFDYIASKTLHIYDDNISGDAFNNQSGTKNGITYNNSRYVLRYVFGV